MRNTPTALLLALCLTACTAAAQTLPTPVAANRPAPTAADTARGVAIVERYAQYVDLSRLPKDSILYAVTLVTNTATPGDTMTMYRWYQAGGRCRIEMHAKGQLQMGIYSNGRDIFRLFSEKYRDWRITDRTSFIDYSSPYHPSGALGKWYSHAGEAYYAGEYLYNGHKVDRVHVSMAGFLDRFFYFEQETGLPFLSTDLMHQLDGSTPDPDMKVDWRGWHEFTPVGDCWLPSVESYQADGALIVMRTQYRLVPATDKPFTENYYRQ